MILKATTFWIVLIILLYKLILHNSGKSQSWGHKQIVLFGKCPDLR